MEIHYRWVADEAGTTQRQRCILAGMTVDIRITVNGRLALTVEQAAIRYGIARSSMRAALTRLPVKPVAALDGRKWLYLAVELDQVMKARPGRGRRPPWPEPAPASTPTAPTSTRS